MYVYIYILQFFSGPQRLRHAILGGNMFLRLFCLCCGYCCYCSYWNYESDFLLYGLTSVTWGGEGEGLASLT